jgi:hypothetical protein
MNKTNKTCLLHELFFSLNLSSTLTAFLIYGRGTGLNWDLWKAQKFLSIMGSEFGTIYWLFPPTATICLWLLLRVSQNKQLTLSVLQSAAGVLAIGATPLWFLARYADIDSSHPWAAFQNVGSYEAVVALCCTGLYLKRRWPLPGWASLLMLLAHHGFWLWQFQGYLRGYLVGLQASLHYALEERSLLMRALAVLRTLLESGWSDLVAITALLPITGLLSGLGWALYISSRTNHDRRDTSNEVGFGRTRLPNQ